MSTPNLPHTENLTPLYELVTQLQQLVTQNNSIHNSITHSVDSLALNRINISQSAKVKRLESLKARNTELKSKLANTVDYVNTITALINNYELSIEVILERARDNVVDYNLQLLSTNKDLFDRLYKMNEKEYAEYFETASKRHMMVELSKKMREALSSVDSVVDGGSTTAFKPRDPSPDT